MRFRDRSDAGRQLASRLLPLRGEDVVVLGLPRGGVPVAVEVARAIRAPLDVILVRKLGVPAQPELGMGAIGEGDAKVINADVVRYAGVSEADITAVERRERSELERRITRFRGDVPREPLTGRIAVLVDDGIATGSTARAACQVARAQGAARVVLAVPVAPPSAEDAGPATPTSWSAWRCRSGSWRSASGMTTSPRPVTMRWSRCWERHGLSTPGASRRNM